MYVLETDEIIQQHTISNLSALWVELQMLYKTTNELRSFTFGLSVHYIRVNQKLKIPTFIIFHQSGIKNF
jgi:hypothetical protein